ncbi:hypothetical protein JXA88_19410 [Candidatus Fermentibacteria bacterium]|nr:hypothetical protein [Candidatus Fermentibacteria bacterium]
MRYTALVLSMVLALVGLMGCGAFLPLDEEGVPSARIVLFDPSPVAPVFDPQRGVLLPTSNIYVANYSQVPVTFDAYQIRYYEATSLGGAALSDLDNQGLFTLYVPGVPTPDPYLPDSTATRQTAMIGVGGLQILTAKAYEKVTNGTADYDDDLDMYAVVTFRGQTDSEIDVEIQGAVVVSSLLQEK